MENSKVRTSDVYEDHGSRTWESAVERLRSDSRLRQLSLDAYYDDPLSGAANRYWRSAEWASVRRLLPPAGSRVLDAGAGRGIASFALAKDGYLATALEPDSSGIVGTGAIRGLVAESGVKIEVVAGTIEQAPFPDGSFDAVFARAAMHHARDLRQACVQLRRVLKPGGRLIAIREHVISRPRDKETFLDQHPLHRDYGGENAYLLREYREAITAAGFRSVQTIAPLEDVMNFAPYDVAGLQGAIATQLGSRLPLPVGAIRKALQVPLVWRLVRPIMGLLDNRPGRLYSFVAEAPTNSGNGR